MDEAQTDTDSSNPENDSGLSALSRQFVTSEYNALRTEMDHCQDRAFKLITGGIFIVPAAEYLAKTQDIGVLRMLLPLVVISFYVLVSAQLHAIRRYGVYIRTQIESAITEVEGWEQWLEKSAKPRMYEWLLGGSVYLFSLLFYVVAVLIAATVPINSEDPVFAFLNGLPSWVPTHPDAWPVFAIIFYSCLLLLVAVADMLEHLVVSALQNPHDR